MAANQSHVLISGDHDDSSDLLQESSQSNRQMSKLKQIIRFGKHKLCSRMVLTSIACGQVLAILMAITGLTSTYISKQGIFVPLAQNYPHYTLLSLTFTPIALYRWLKQENHDGFQWSLQHWYRQLSWRYVLIALLDVHGNWCLVAAYNYTNIVSVQLLDCFSIASAVFFSKLCLRLVYLPTHYCALFGCIIGMGLMIYADFLKQDGKHNLDLPDGPSSISPRNRAVLGDLLVVLGSCFYGASNVMQEYLLRKTDFVNCVGFISPWSSMLSLIYFMSMEFTMVKNLLLHQLTTMVALAWLGYIVVMYSFALVMVYMLRVSNAVLFNLSVLTTDFYALLLGIFIFNETFHPLFAVAFIIIIFNVALFLLYEPQTPQQHQPLNVEENI